MTAAFPMTMLTVPVDHLPETDPDALYARVEDGDLMVLKTVGADCYLDADVLLSTALYDRLTAQCCPADDVYDVIRRLVGQVRDAVLAGPTPLTSTLVQVPAAGPALAHLHRIEGDAVIVIDVAPPRQ